MNLDKTRLKPWLVQQLEPITDADPVVLSDYIIALLKYDSTSVQDFKSHCSNQLDDFLNQNTVSFVDRLYTFLTIPEITAPSSLKRKSTASPRTEPAKQLHRSPSTLPTTKNAMGIYSDPASESEPGTSARRNERMYPRNEESRLQGPPSREYCKDYHHRGFCARGDACPFQHDDAAHLVPLDSTYATQSRMFPQQQQQQQQQQMDSSFRPPPRQSTSTLSHPPPFQQPFFHKSGSPAFTHGSPSFQNISPQQSHPSSIVSQGRQPSNNMNRRNESPSHPPESSKAPPSPAIVVENIPRESFTLLAINTFFAKFGIVRDVSLDYAHARATIIFDNVDQAQRALSSPEAIFGNRFVRVYRSRIQSTSLIPSSSTPFPPLIVTPQTLSPDISPAHPPTSLVTPNYYSTSAPASATKLVNSAPVFADARIKVQRDRAIALERNAMEQKRLMDSMNATGSTVEEKRAIMKQLRQLAQESSTLTAVNDDTSNGTKTSTATPLSSMQILTNLRREAESLGIDPSAPASSLYRGSTFTTSTRGRGRGGYSIPSTRVFKLDNRSTKLRIDNVPVEASLDALKVHFNKFGEVTSVERSSAYEVVVGFRERTMAETALARGSIAADLDAPLNIQWSIADETEHVRKEEKVERFESFDDTTMTVSSAAGASEGQDDDRERSWNR